MCCRQKTIVSWLTNGLRYRNSSGEKVNKRMQYPNIHLFFFYNTALKPRLMSVIQNSVVGRDVSRSDALSIDLFALNELSLKAKTSSWRSLVLTPGRETGRQKKSEEQKSFNASDFPIFQRGVLKPQTAALVNTKCLSRCVVWKTSSWNIWLDESHRHIISHFQSLYTAAPLVSFGMLHMWTLFPTKERKERRKYKKKTFICSHFLKS